MIRFYWSLLREIPAVFRHSAEAWVFWILSVAAPLAVLLNPQLQQRINTPQFSRWFVLVRIALSVSYGMLRVNYERFETTSAGRDAALERITQLEAGKPITRAEWMDMANQFGALRDRPLPALWEHGGITATWHQVGERESWALWGGTSETRRELKALCKRAGAMLLKSPNVVQQLSPRVRAHHDPVDRWLELLREEPDLSPRLTGSGNEFGTPAKSETFESLASLSAAVCVSCSAEEIV
jgi:hypothetical protein